MEVALMPFGSLLAALEGIHDPRRPQGQRYSLSHLLLFAVLAGATSYQKIITFIAVQRDRLNTAFGACLRRAPAVNTLRRLLERDDLEAAFRRHADELNGTVQVTGKRTIALDGKALRGSFDHLNDRTAAHVLSAFASDAALILAHQEVAGAPGEIPAVPTLMEDLGLTGVLFTADALHCQKDSFPRAAAMACWSRGSRTSPPCMKHWPGSAPSPTPSTATGGVARSIDWSRSSTPAGPRVAAADHLRRPGFAPDLREGHPVCGRRVRRSAATPVRSVSTPRPSPAPSALTGALRTGTITFGMWARTTAGSGKSPARWPASVPLRSISYAPMASRTSAKLSISTPSTSYQRPQLRQATRARILMTRTEWPWVLP